MILAYATRLAEEAKAELAPYCARIEIAGSIRRKKPEPNDIELVCIPDSPRLYDFANIIHRWPKIKGLPTGKYTQRVYHGQKLDLFICQPKTWACVYTIRTGSVDFSHGLAIRARQVGLCFKNGQLWHLTPKDPTELFSLEGIREEADVFRALKIKWVEPELRRDTRDIEVSNDPD